MAFRPDKEKSQDYNDKSPAGRIVQDLINIALNYEAWWTSPHGKACQLTTSGLWIPELNGAIPWGDIEYADLLAIARDNYSGIKKISLVTRDKAGFPVKKTKYIPKFTEAYLREERKKLITAAESATWEELPQALPEPPLPPEFDSEVPF